MKKGPGVRKQKGFTLIECLVATVIMTVGILSLASVFAQGLKNTNQAQMQFIAQQKAQQAMESIYSARDTRLLTSDQINNVGTKSGIFSLGPQPLLGPGPDSLYGTTDDDANNPDTIAIGPGPDKIFGTADDVTLNLNPFMTRTITILPVANTPNLNSVTVTVNWTYMGQTSQYQIVSFISNFD
ncbi:MAG: prepilin-type N-terminal cleavage/methylation domain-containing protein [Candidatus Acidiferrum sp.]